MEEVDWAKVAGYLEANRGRRHSRRIIKALVDRLWY